MTVADSSIHFATKPPLGGTSHQRQAGQAEGENGHRKGAADAAEVRNLIVPDCFGQ
jgi:hypothetical protein